MLKCWNVQMSKPSCLTELFRKVGGSRRVLLGGCPRSPGLPPLNWLWKEGEGAALLIAGIVLLRSCCVTDFCFARKLSNNNKKRPRGKLCKSLIDYSDMIQSDLGKGPTNKSDEFWEKSKRGGEASFSIQKFMLQILGTLNRFFWAWNW